MTAQPEGFAYIADFLSFPQQIALLKELRCLQYEHEMFRGQLMKRAWAQFGYRYGAAAHNVEPALPMPAYLQTILQNARIYYPDDLTFTQCIVTKYVPSAGIGWHADSRVFGDYLLGLSLASEARLQFRPKKTQKASFEVTVAPGSLYVMHGSARYDYDHRIMPVKTERYSLTFRYLAQEELEHPSSPRHAGRISWPHGVICDNSFSAAITRNDMEVVLMPLTSAVTIYEEEADDAKVNPGDLLSAITMTPGVHNDI